MIRSSRTSGRRHITFILLLLLLSARGGGRRGRRRCGAGATALHVEVPTGDAPAALDRGEQKLSRTADLELALPSTALRNEAHFGAHEDRLAVRIGERGKRSRE